MKASNTIMIGKLVKSTLLALVALVVSAPAFSQQVFFSQYHLTPMYSNPGMVAASSNIQADAGYRNQFGGYQSNMRSFIATGIYPFFKKVGSDKIRTRGVGISLLNDQTGTMRYLRTTGVSAAYAQNVELATDHYLSLGLQAGFYQRRIDFGDLRSGSQFDPFAGQFDRSRSLNEDFTSDAQKGFGNINTGVYYYHEEQDAVKYYAGLSTFNLIRPNVSLTGATTRYPVNWLFVAGGRAYENREWIVQPNMRVITRASESQANVGSGFYYKLREKRQGAITKDGHIGLNAWYSVNNAVILGFEIAQPDWSLGLSYDVIASKQAEANSGTRAVELMVGFRKFIGSKKKSNFVPLDESDRPGAKPAKTGDTKTEPTAPSTDKPAVEPAKPAEPVQPTQPEIQQPTQPQTPVEKPAEPAKPKQTAPADPAANTEVGYDPYKGTKMELTPEEKELLKQQPKYKLNDYSLSPETITTLNKLADLMKKKPSLKLEIRGYGCNLGPDAATDKISWARAETARRYLIKKGVAASRLSVKAFGNENPVADNETEEGRAKNRRVEFYLKK